MPKRKYQEADQSADDKKLVPACVSKIPKTVLRILAKSPGDFAEKNSFKMATFKGGG